MIRLDYIKNANYISAPESFGDICPVFKGVFWMDKEVTNATLQITSLGFYKAVFNGEILGKFIFAPGWTSYSKRLQYQEYNVTNLIEECNTLDVGVGAGRLIHYPGLTPALICCLHVEYGDGGEQNFYSDGSWKCAKSNIVYSHLYNGETVDFTADTDGEYPVTVRNDIDKNILISQEGEETREMARLSAAELIHTPSGETVIDFGQNLTGYVEWVVPSKKGHTYSLLHAEVLDKNGNFYTENLRGAKCRVDVVSDGKPHTVKPTYTFQGFRYIKLLGFEDSEIDLENFNAVVVFSDMKRTGFFACGNDLIQQLYENIIWGQRGNFLDVPTDCPQRDERLGWTGDAQVFCRTASINYRTDKFFRKWLHDLACDQHQCGAVPHVVPMVCEPMNGWFGEFDENLGGATGWADACVIVPYWLYRTYGDTAVIKEQFDSMKKWILYMESRGSERGLFDLRKQNFGDWLDLNGDGVDASSITDTGLISTAFFAYSNSLFIKMGEVIGEDMSYFKELYNLTVSQYRKHYLNREEFPYNTQTALVLAIYFDLAEDVAALGEKLCRDIEEKGHMTTGFLGTGYLLHVLTKLGRTDLAYKLLFKKDYPSWLYPVTKGATTIWERWNGIMPNGDFNTPGMNSFNHYAYGCVGDWLYSTVAGIDSDFDEPAYKHIIFRPLPSKELGYAKARILTENGEIISSWEYTGKGDECKFSFTVPNGSHATLYLDDEEYEFQSGTYNTVFEYKGF